MDVLTAQVLGAIALVLAVSSLLGEVARHCGQPSVVGQILAGILLGPSLLGRLPGHLTSRLFPRQVLPYLTILSQIAIVIFMFVVGYELDRGLLHAQRQAASLVAIGALFVPMGLGAGAVLILKSMFAAAGQPTFSHSFVLFIAVAVSVTALPVLAAITRERGIVHSAAGVTATTAAGIMDVAAWIALAAAIAGSANKPGLPWPMIFLLISCFVVIMLVAVRPVLRWWINRPGSVLSDPLLVAAAFALASGWVTASLGLHPVFGGFLAGLTMPYKNGHPDAGVLHPLEQVSGVLLPVFFVVTGLSVNIAALDSGALLLLTIICAIASIGKLGPAYLGSRIGGLTPKDSAVVAVLVNTRGLTELIVLNTGLSEGLIYQRLFSILVLMALITTAATTPLLSLFRVPPVQLAPG